MSQLYSLIRRIVQDRPYSEWYFLANTSDSDSKKEESDEVVVLSQILCMPEKIK